MEESNHNIKSQTVAEELQTFINEIAVDFEYKEFKVTFEDDDFNGTNFLGDITRVKIFGETFKEKKLELNLLIKKAVTTLKNCDVPLSTFYQREIAVYNQILPAFKKLQISRGILENDCIKFAKLFKSSVQEGKEFLIMNDLTHDGYQMYMGGKSPMDYEHVEVIIKYLAHFHASSLVLHETNPKLLEKLSTNVSITSNMSDDLLQIIDGVANKILNEMEDTLFKKKAEEVIKNMKPFCDNLLDSKQHSPYNVICHGDPWAYNMLFQYKNSKVEDVILIDWQIVRFAPPASDIACCLCLCTDGPILDQHFHRLLEVYYSTLEEQLTKMGSDINKLYPKYIFEEHIRMYMIFGFFSSFLGFAMFLNDPGEEQSLGESMQIGLKFNDNIKERISQLINFYGKYDLF